MHFILESATCIKDAVFSIAGDIDNRLTDAAIPMAIVEWRYNQKNKKPEKGASSSLCKIELSKREIDDLVSGNVYKTKEAFFLVGVDLASNGSDWETWKERIQAIVTRRNNIVHRNDDASDISFSDIRNFIGSVRDYLDFIEAACLTSYS